MFCLISKQHSRESPDLENWDEMSSVRHRYTRWCMKTRGPLGSLASEVGAKGSGESRGDRLLTQVYLFPLLLNWVELLMPDLWEWSQNLFISHCWRRLIFDENNIHSLHAHLQMPGEKQKKILSNISEWFFRALHSNF